MAARVSLSSKYPSLMLEELEDLVIDIHCADDRVSISVIPARFFALCSTLDDYDEFLLITSHYGCNDKGSRLAYL